MPKDKDMRIKWLCISGHSDEVSVVLSEVGKLRACSRHFPDDQLYTTGDYTTVNRKVLIKAYDATTQPSLYLAGGKPKVVSRKRSIASINRVADWEHSKRLREEAKETHNAAVDGAYISYVLLAFY